MNEHDMISNIDYIYRLYPETTEKILIKHGADPSNEYWTDGCDVAGAYEELLQCLNSRYDRTDPDTQLDYHIQEILGWHDVNERVESELEIPAPYNQYYEFSPNEVNFDDLPDAFDHYKDLKVVAELYAKEQYEDALANNCLDFCWLVEDEVGKLLLVTTAGLRVYPVTLEEVLECVGSFTEDVSSSNESSTALLTIEVMSGVNADGFTAIVKDSISGEEIFRQTYYYGYDASYDRRWASSRAPYVTDIINDLKNKYNVVDVEVTTGKNIFRGDSMSSDSVEKFKRNYLSEDVFENNEYLDDYKESLFEDTQMTDAQRLALQELDTCLECGEITQEEHDYGQNIQWDINFEDVVLFVSGVEDSLKDIKHVAYGDCDESQFDGCYVVTLNNGQVKKYGWHDYDFSGALTLIECNEGILDTVKSLANPLSLLSDHTKETSGEVLTEDTDDGWEKPFNWNERYVKDGFVIYNNHQGAWHLEQTRPKTKHIGNYKSLEAAKAAGDKEIAAKADKNRDMKPQWDVHQFSKESVIFRGTEEECANYINDNELWDDAEIYMILPDDPYYRNLEEDYARVDAKDFVKHPMNYDVTSMLDFEVQDDVKIYIHRGPGRQREFYIIIGDTYVQHAFSNLQTVEKYLRRNHLVKEVISESFKPGDVVYVTVANKQGRVTKMVSPDVVEVEIDDFMNPVRTDRFYTDEVELIQSDFDEGLLDNILDPLNII